MSKNFLFYLLPSIVTGILGALVMVPVTTFFLQPEDFGVFAILSAITMPIGPLGSTGVSWVLSSNYYALDERDRKSLMYNILLLEFALKSFWVILFWLTSSTILPFLVKDFNPEYLLYFKVLLISTLLSSFWPSVSFFIILQNRGSIHAIFEIAQWVVGAITAGIGLILFKWTTIVLFLIPLASSAVSFLLSLLYIRKHVKMEIRKKWLIEIFKVGMPTIPVSSLEMLTNVTDRYFIQRWLSLSLLGIYSHAQSYRNIFTTFMKAFSRTIVPPMLEAFTKNTDLQKEEGNLTIWYGVLALAGIFTALYSYEIVDVLTHGKFIAAASLIPLWFLLVLSSTFGMPYTNFLLVRKKSAFLAYSFIIVCPIFIGITAFSVYAFGLTGGVVSIVCSNFTIQLVRKVYAKRLGCTAVAEKEFLFVTSVVIGFHLAVSMVTIGFLWKSLIFITAAVLIIYFFNIGFLFRNMMRGEGIIGKYFTNA
jgi:O-antigen/teichoic acid export membrane protein